MGSSMVMVLILLQVLATWAHLNNGGASLRGSDAARSLGSFRPSKKKTAAAVWSAIETKRLANKREVKSRITNNWAYVKDAIKKAGIADVKELAMFIANTMHESGELSLKAELSVEDKDYNWGVCEGVTNAELCKGDKEDPVPKGTECCQGQGCKSKCKVHYFGRGYLQTTYYKNYKEAKEDGNCKWDSNGKEVDIVANPEKVAEDEKLAWCTAGHFWKTNVHDDRCKKGCEMGNTIHAINGPLECAVNGKAAKKGGLAQKRFCYFKHFWQGYERQELDKSKAWWADKTCVTALDGMCPLRPAK